VHEDVANHDISDGITDKNYNRRRTDLRIDTLEGHIKALDLSMRIKFETVTDTLDTLQDTLEQHHRVPWRVVILLALVIIFGDVIVAYVIVRGGGILP